MANCGIYMVEDVHTAYLSEFGGGLKTEGGFVEYAKSLVDRLNAERSRRKVGPDEFLNETWRHICTRTWPASADATADNRHKIQSDLEFTSEYFSGPNVRVGLLCSPEA